ncbi:uncharacterized protein [Rutidosis leptorrhynchoides]|uniref:uncharacterized protein n=1 Tax=Rutidosis leptorrhynchoides TaxID=125765 RepID=UPI003A99370D
MTSAQTGEAWVMEVLNGHPIRSVNAFRMHPDLFIKLCGELETNYGLQSTDKMSTFEMVGIFMYTLALGLSNRDVMERFQRSGETISRAFHEVLKAIIGRDKGFQGLDCIGCIDGTHIRACITESQQLPYIGRKGLPTFNVMATCDFDMCFTYVSVGWEGSAHDTRVFMHSIQNKSMNFPQPPEGRYYLVDKGYPDRKGYLVPYPKTRYHQSQFQKEPPNNMQEAFNRSHSPLRSYIERSFGILKKRFHILSEMPRFSVQTQIDVITATFALHNYIRTNSQEDIMTYAPKDYLKEEGMR